MKKEALRLDKVTYMVDDAPVLENINLHLFEGEVFGLICLNAYGQDELVQLLTQNLPLHYGKVYLADGLVNSYEHSNMAFNRVAVIDQQSKLINDLTVADNIFVLRRGFKKYVVNRPQLNRQLDGFIEELGLDIRGSQLVEQLSTIQKCIVELLKAVVLGTRLIVVKNISNYVTTENLARFHQLLRYYAAKGFTFLYICSHHEEAFKVCDRLAILQNAHIVRVIDKSQFTRESIRPFYQDFYRNRTFVSGGDSHQGTLRLEGVCAGTLRQMGFAVEAGECVVLLDTDNTVLEDMLAVMRGRAPDSGSIFVSGKPYTPVLARRPTENGVAFIQQYPVESMLFWDMTYLENLCFLMDERRPRVRMSARIRDSVLREYAPLVGPDIAARDITGLARASLYNLIYYRVHLGAPRVVFCVQPFSDADMMLRLQINQLIGALKHKGIAVVILAVNLSDSLLVADRLLMARQGQVEQEFSREDFYLLDEEATSVQGLVD